MPFDPAIYTQPTKNPWFPDQVEPVFNPNDPIDDNQFKAYWEQEKDRCINGFYLADGQVKVPGKLYFHTVYFKIGRYVEVERGTKKVKTRIIDTPLLRDIDWDIFDDLERCTDEGRFYNLVGSRDFGKSVVAASCAAHLYTFVNNSESVISSSESTYIKLVFDKIEDGLLNIHPLLKKQRLTSDWKREIRAGWKEKTTNLPAEGSSHSRILNRNYEMGTKTMAANGTRPGFHLIDEEGTLPNLIGCLKDSDGCWWSGDGDKPSSLVMVTGCVCAGTKVWAKDGRLLNIEELNKEDGLIGYDSDGVVAQTINWFKVPEEKKCYRITTDNNTVIECSYDHPLLLTRRKFITNTTEGKYKRAIYQEAEHIQINDQLLLPSEVPVFGNTSVAYARAFGLMIGDGNCTVGSTPTYSVSEEPILNYLEKTFEKTWRSKEYKIDANRNFCQVGVGDKEFKEQLIAHGLYGKVKFDKRLPSCVHTYDKKSICELLAGYFDADGNVYYNKRKGIVRVVLTSVVKELLEEVKYQLLKLGIHSSIVKENRKHKPTEEYKGQHSCIYRLYINQQQDLQLFKKNIKLLSKEKSDKLKYIKKSKYKKFDAVFEINPLNNKEGYFSNNTLKNLRYETVKSVEYIGEKEVYNLNCGPNHNYLSNGLITRQTGGDMDKGAEAAEVFFNPEAYNFLAFDNHWEDGRKIGRFIPATRAKMAYKEPKSLSEYLGISHPDLDRITILVSNEEKAKEEWWDREYAKAKKSGNPKAILKFKAYWPLKPSDSFIVLTQNDFNVEAAKVQQARVRNNGITGSAVEIYNDGEGLKHRFSEKGIITEFPVKTQSKDAPIIMWEPPISNPPFGLYIAGIDPYRTDESEYSDSLGAVYIYKRTHNVLSEKYQDMFVAAYVARPKTQDVWNENVRNLLKYYNALALCENDEMSFINYMLSKNEGHYLQDQPDWLTEIVPNTKVNKKKGIHRSSKQVRTFLDACLKRYLDDVLDTNSNEDGSLRETLGVSRIMDPMLLEEIIKFNKTEGNYDRIVAVECALALAEKMKPLGTVNSSEDDPRLKSILNRERSKNNLFAASRPMYTNRRKRGSFL